MSDRKIVEYFLCISEGSINDHLDEGWVLYGSPFELSSLFDENDHKGWAQAMVRYEEEPTYITAGKCSFICHCGGSIKIDRSTKLVSNPPKYNGDCDGCNQRHYIECSLVD